MNRYKKANTAEKAIFTTLNKALTSHTSFGVDKRELKGEKSRVKYVFDLKKNNGHIHTLEFGTKHGEVVNIRLVVSRPTLKSDFYKALLKGKGVTEAKASYGGIVVHFDATSETSPEILKFIDKLNGASEAIELNPKRTYCDPPAGWVEGNDGRQGLTKNEKSVKETPEAKEIKAPKAQKEEISEENAAQAAAENDMEKAV